MEMVAAQCHLQQPSRRAATPSSGTFATKSALLGSGATPDFRPLTGLKPTLTNRCLLGVISHLPLWRAFSSRYRHLSPAAFIAWQVVLAKMADDLLLCDFLQ
jgi:hypothetical protein